MDYTVVEAREALSEPNESPGSATFLKF